MTWTSTLAETVTIEPGIGIVDSQGAIVVSPVDTTSYTLTVEGMGSVETDTVTITVVHPPSASISAEPTSIFAGDPVTLSWETTYAEKDKKRGNR